MAATLEEYRDILIADTFVDLPRLKLRAQHGVPEEIRQTFPRVMHAVWCLLYPCAPIRSDLFPDGSFAKIMQLAK